MVKVLFITNILETGGAETYFVKCENQLNDNKINIFTAAKRGSFVKKLKNPEKFTVLTNNYLKNFYSLFILVRKEKINIVHANSFTMLLYCILLKGVYPRIKLIYTKHNVTVIEKYAPRLLALIINIFVNKVITVYERQRIVLIEQGVKSRKTICIYNGVDINQFKFFGNEKANESKKIGILGRLSPEKNHSLFLQAAKLIVNTGNECTFFIAGDGPEKVGIMELIKKLELENHVELLGNIDNPEIFLRSLDVLVLTSTTEAFPMSILESFAVGVPVVSINVGGINEIIKDNETGVLINNFCEKEFADRIIHVLTNSENTRIIKQAARQLVEVEFNSQKMISEIREIYMGNAL